MILFAIVVALLLGQVRPLLPGNLVHAGYGAWAVSVRRNFDTGRAGHGWLALALAAGLPAVLVLGTDWLLRDWAWPLHIVWLVALLYATLGLGPLGEYLTRIRTALEGDGDNTAPDADDAGENTAAQALAQWQRVDVAQVLARGPVLPQALRHALLAAHRQVFGVLFWFVALALLGLGPLGAVLYRMAAHLARADAPASALRHAARRLWWLMDWLPARLTALLFAVVGNFEDALEGWRFYAARPADADGTDGADVHDGVVLASAAGALRLRLNDDADDEAGDADASHDGRDGAAPQPAHLRSVAALVWRALVVCLLLLVLMSMARLMG